jgi:hypothetical protein
MAVIGQAVAALVAWRAWREAREVRREARLGGYISAVHSREATPGETVATFWLGRLYARYGTDRQLEDWYRIVHGPVGGGQ